MRRTVLLVISAVVAVAMCPNLVSGATIFNALNQPTRITDLTIPGYGSFDVSIAYDTSFNDIFGAGDPLDHSPKFFGNEVGATAAVDAMMPVLNAVDLALRTPLTEYNATSIMVPREFTTDGSIRYTRASTAYEDGQQSDYERIGDYTANRNFHSDRYGIATFAPNSVPEPTSFVMFSGLSIMGLVAARRRKRAA